MKLYIFFIIIIFLIDFDKFFLTHFFFAGVCSKCCLYGDDVIIAVYPFLFPKVVFFL